MNQQAPPTLSEFESLMIPLLKKNDEIFDDIVDLDQFFSSIYTYYINKGFYPSILKKIIVLVQYILLVTVLFITCYRINYTESLENKILIFQPMRYNVLNIFLLSLSFLGGLIYLIHLYKFLIDMYGVKTFLNINLKLTDENIQNIHWYTVVNIIIDAQEKYKFYKLHPTLSNFQITHHIMRTDNIMIALLKKDLITTQLVVPYWNYNWPYLPKLYVMCIQHCIISSMFNQRKQLNNQSNIIQIITQKLTFYSCGILLFSPFIVLILGMYFIFRYFEDFRQNKYGIIRFRRWSRYSIWLFRQHNELYHILHKRLSVAYIYADLYIQNFTNELSLILARFLAFVCGTILVTFLALSIIDEDYLYVHIFEDKTILWFIGVCGILLSTCRILIKDEYHLFAPDRYMSKVIQHINYFPTIWKNNFHTHWVKNDFTLLFQHRIVYILEELLSIILVPYLLYYKVRFEVPAIVDFIVTHIKKDRQYNLGYIYNPPPSISSTTGDDLEKSIDEEIINLVRQFN